MDEHLENIPIKLPVVFVENIVVFPNTELRMDIVDPESNRVVKFAEQYQNMVVIAFIKPNMPKNINNIFKIGLIAKIVLNAKNPNGTNRVKFRGLSRVEIVDSIVEDGTLHSVVIKKDSYSTDLDSQRAVINLINEELFNTDELPNNAAIRNVLTTKNLSSDILTDSIVNAIPLNYEEKIKYLIELNVDKRLTYILEDIRKQILIKDLEKKIDDEVKRSINESQKEYYLREKMKAIQEELGDKAKRDSDIEEIRKQIISANMPTQVLAKAKSELNRYIMTPGNSAESGIIKTYLDFLLSLPWDKESTDIDDIKIASDILDADHYGLEKVKDRILEYLAVKVLNKKNPQAILCLVGPPGVGKTSLARSIARALDKKFIKLALGGVKDESEIRGHRRTYLGALPGRILQNISKAGTKNPVFLLDEIDKMSSDYKGDPTSAMLEVLDSEQNKFFSDHYLEESFDLSQVFFIATANYLENIPAPLRDRMEIVEVSSYTEYEKFEIAKKYLLTKQLQLHGLSSELFTITDQAIYQIIQDYTRESGVRELERLLGTIIRKVIKKILMENVERVEINVLNLEEYLGKKRFSHNMAEERDRVGVVTGLAYTQFGGDTLQVEVTHYKGSGKLMLTGKLGDVMKESAQAALSYVKTNYAKFDINYDLFNDADIHIHVPEGATPKDGPSAGVTIATAIISSFSNKPVNHFVGMTGEITLRGEVLPIGGLREKSIAAHRSGLKTIVIPQDNLRDLDEIPETVKNQLEIISATSIEDVVKIALK